MRRLRAEELMVAGVALLGAYAVYRLVLAPGPTTAFDLTAGFARPAAAGVVAVTSRYSP